MAITPKQASRTTAVRRKLALRSSSTGLLVRYAQQQPDDDKIGHHRAAPVADEGERDAGQRDQLKSASQDDQRLQGNDRSQPRGKQRTETRPGAQGDKKA